MLRPCQTHVEFVGVHGDLVVPPRSSLRRSPISSYWSHASLPQNNVEPQQTRVHQLECQLDYLGILGQHGKSYIRRACSAKNMTSKVSKVCTMIFSCGNILAMGHGSGKIANSDYRIKEHDPSYDMGHHGQVGHSLINNNNGQ